MLTTYGKVAGLIERHRGLVLPVAAAGFVFALIVPMPPAVMDVLLAGNLALSTIILLSTIYAASPLELSVFPTLLLGSTLLRMVLNIATTRLVLTAGDGGRDLAHAQLAAGKVVWAFSTFVPSGSLAAGVILFAILVIIQFIVVTKGAARISEVHARFTLDAMPGKQLAIDSDLNSNLITEDQARHRRSQIAQEADFYGAMDGASKFLRGDAVAAVLIILVNILGGMYVGMAHYGWSWGVTVDLFTRLTIGDGLVTQIPAFILSVASALLVTRGNAKTHLGEQVISQLVGRPAVLVITAIFLGAMMLTSLPKAPLALLAIGLAGLAWILSRRAKDRQPVSSPDQPASAPAPKPAEAPAGVDPLRIELGFGLLALVDSAKGGDLLERIAELRRGAASELGLLVPPIRVRDNMNLDPHSYALVIRGAKAASGRLYLNQLLAIADGPVTGKLHGRETEDPILGQPAVWISPAQRSAAGIMNYTVMEPAAVLGGHLGEIIRRHAPDLLSRQQVAALIEGLEPKAPCLVKEVGQKLKVAQVQKVLQNLLAERVAIHDLETILEAMSDAADHEPDTDLLTEHVRARLARTLSQQYCGPDGKVWCVTLSPEQEEIVTRYGSGGPGPALLPAEIGQKLCQSLCGDLQGLQRQGRWPVVLCSPPARLAVKRCLASAMPQAAVLGYNEIDSVLVQPVAPDMHETVARPDGQVSHARTGVETPHEQGLDGPAIMGKMPMPRTAGNEP